MKSFVSIIDDGEIKTEKKVEKPKKNITTDTKKKTTRESKKKLLITTIM